MNKLLGHSFSLFGERTRIFFFLMEERLKTKEKSGSLQGLGPCIKTGSTANSSRGAAHPVHLALPAPATPAASKFSNTPRQLRPWHSSLLYPPSPWPSPTAPPGALPPLSTPPVTIQRGPGGHLLLLSHLLPHSPQYFLEVPNGLINFLSASYH